ncbi:hypothetical protein Slala03_50840 [Streptomyces lavendulae subsp. lavendulae]|nr:hypothetical protein Slala03_50840 [Streptomyces lavendulae subsp. lavendulae]
MDGEELHHAHDPCRVPDPDSHLSTFRHTVPVWTADHAVRDRDTPTSPLTQGGAGPTASGPRPWRPAYLIAAFTEEKGIDSRHVAFMVLSINGAQ